MKLYPAIDILDGKAVRLVKGNFDARKVYDEDPLAAAAIWAGEGAEQLHVVDLDGARYGTPRNFEHLRRMAQALAVPIQFGGGLRTLQAISGALESGADRVVLGTAAFTDSELLDEALTRWPGRIVVSVDVRGGRVATAGWTKTVSMSPEQAIGQLWQRGAGELVYTNVDRDGMLTGPDLGEVADIAKAVRGSFIYSGGIGGLKDLERLASLGASSLAGVIAGKALYEKRFTVPEGRAALDQATV